MIRKLSASFWLFLLPATLLFSDETNEEALARILKDAVSLSVHSQLIVNEEENLWESDITKVTVPGRKVTLLYETGNEKLSIELTPFKVEEGTYMLTAVSNFWHESEDGIQFRSSFKSINLKVEEEILFYPLGIKTQEKLTGGNLYMELSIRISPYNSEFIESAE